MTAPLQVLRTVGLELEVEGEEAVYEDDAKGLVSQVGVEAGAL